MPVPPTRASVYKRIIRPILFITGLIFFIFLVVRSWHEIQALWQTINWLLFFLSVSVAILDNILLSILFRNLLTKYAFHLKYSHVGRMFFYGQIAKYIPGRLWNVLYHATFSQQPNATSAMLFTNLDLMNLGILRTFTIALALILFPRQPLVAGSLFIVGAIAFIYFSNSCWIAHIFQFIAYRIEKLRHNLAQCHIEIYWATLLLIYSGLWITFLTANFLLMAAMGFSLQESALYIAYFGIAWILGVISFVMPAGIGIREVAFVFLAGYLGQGQIADAAMLAAIAIIFRFWQICLDIGGLGVGFVLSLYERIYGENR